ncbi:MAG TPA: hypothetical protein VMI52_13765 [Acetobacteraceae bacterium]|nr:hypothetical protein [Acetobacteraceae bacterium]
MPDFARSSGGGLGIDLAQFCQQMGEVLSGLKSLEKQIDLVRAEMERGQHEHRWLEEKLNNGLLTVRQDVDALKTTTAAGTHATEELTAALAEMRKPVAEIMALRARAVGVLLTVSAAGSVALCFIDPLLRWISGPGGRQ